MSVRAWTEWPWGHEDDPWVVTSRGARVHETAIVNLQPMRGIAFARPVKDQPMKELPRGVVVGPYAIIYAGAEIGEDTQICPRASIREGAKIGARCVIGNAVSIHYDAVIGDDCRFVDGAHITGGCRVGRGCFFGPGVLTSNDRNIDLKDYRFRGITPPVFGERVMVGTGANILAGVTVGDDAVIGIGAVVVKDVPAGARVMGPRAMERPRW